MPLLIPQSYDERFVQLIDRIRTQYGDKLLYFSGIHPEQLDLPRFTRDYLFTKTTKAVADYSIDANANISDKSIVSFDYESPKPGRKLDSMSILWENIISECTAEGHGRYALAMANDALKAILTGALYLNDSHQMHKSYSYYEHTPITARINGTVRQMTLKQLFETYDRYAVSEHDAEVVSLEHLSVPVDLEDAPVMRSRNTRRMKRYRTSGFSQHHHPSIRHTVEVWDGDAFVSVSRVLRHRRHNRMVELSVDAGNSLIVTEDHPVILDDGRECPAGELAVGMVLAAAEPYRNWSHRITVTDDLSYVLGFVAGDGNVPRHRFYDQACVVSEDDVAVSYDELRNQFYLYQKNIDASRVAGAVARLGIENKVTTHQNGKVMSFCSLQLSHCCASVFGLSDGNSSYSVRVPWNIMEWNRDAQLSYLAGIIDAEGTMMRSGRTCSVRMASFGMINQLHELCQHLSIHSRVGIAEEGIYRLYLRISAELRIRSEKCTPVNDLQLNAAYDTSATGYAIKHLRFIEEGRFDQSGRDHYAWVYDITTTSGTFYSCGFKAHNCFAFDLTNLVNEGIPFESKIKIRPPRHYRSFIDLTVQSVATISNHIAGAASLPNFLVYLDYFARKDFGNDVYTSRALAEVKQGIQNFVYSMNYSFRGAQCVTEDTEVLTPAGFRRYDQVAIDDPIYVWDDGRLAIQPIEAVTVHEYDGEMHCYTGRDYCQMVTPSHRVIRKKFNSHDYVTEPSVNCIDLDSPISLPVAMIDDHRPDIERSDEFIEFITFILTDGSIDSSKGRSPRIRWYKSPRRWGIERFDELCSILNLHPTVTQRPGWSDTEGEYLVLLYQFGTEESAPFIEYLQGERTIPREFLALSRRQAQMVIDTWALLDGNTQDLAYGRQKLQCDTEEIADDIQHLCFLAGRGSVKHHRRIGDNVRDTIYVIPYARKDKTASTKERVHYTGKVWCPTTKAGVVVYRKNGRVFISGNSPFTNISVYDRVFMRELFGKLIYPDGSRVDYDSIRRLQEVYTEWFNHEMSFQSLTFPILTANMATNDEGELINYDGDSIGSRDIIDEPFLDYVAEANIPYGIMNLYTGPPTALSTCCRLRNKLTKEHTNSLGTGSVSIGSHRVCTINLPRIAIEADYDQGRYLEILDRRIKQSHIILNAHRRIIKTLITNGRLPLYTHHWMELHQQYSTVGIIGIYEACKFMGLDIHTDTGAQFVTDVVGTINRRNDEAEISGTDGRMFNCEMIPGEQAAVKLCEIDRMLYPALNHPYRLYSNQFVPLTERCSLMERLRLQGKFDSTLNGGSIAHMNLDHRIRNRDQMKSLIRAGVRSGAIYYAVNYNIAVCESGHNSVGKIVQCPICGQPIVTNRTRVVGFVTDVSDWNEVRRDEHPERVFYDTDAEVIALGSAMPDPLPLEPPGTYQ